MTEEAKLLELLRKLDPAGDDTAQNKPQGTVVPTPANPEKSATDPGSNRVNADEAAKQATGNQTAQDLRNQGTTGQGSQTAGNEAQRNYRQNAEAANPQMTKDQLKESQWENWNNRSYNDTINMARLANALSKQTTWLSPTLNPMSRGGEGGGYSVNTIANPELNTLEQQATGIAARGAAQRQSQDIARQGRSYDLPVTIEEAVAKGIVDSGTQRNLMDLGVSQQLMTDIWNNIYNQEYSNDIRERFAQYARQLARYENTQDAKHLLAIYEKDPTLAVITAQHWGTQMPSIETWLDNQDIMTALNNMGATTPAQKKQAFLATRYMKSVENLQASAALARATVPAAITGFGTSVLNPGAF